MSSNKQCKEIIIINFSNVTSEGVSLHLNHTTRLQSGIGHFKEFWVSWDKIGQALFDGYTNKVEVDELDRLRNDGRQELKTKER